MELWRQELYASGYSQEYLAHHGIKGQRWGVRRFQNPDGSLTPEGRARYLKQLTDDSAKANKAYASGKYKKAIDISSKSFKNNPIFEDFWKTMDAERMRDLLTKQNGVFDSMMKRLAEIERKADGGKVNEKEIEKLITEYKELTEKTRKIYEETGREKVAKYLDSIGEESLEKAGVDRAHIEKLLNVKLGYAGPIVTGR